MRFYTQSLVYEPKASKLARRARIVVIDMVIEYVTIVGTPLVFMLYRNYPGFRDYDFGYDNGWVIYLQISNT